ncbi:hypothetical protein [Sphingomonas sp. Marseille-Q8236]
MDKTAFRCCFVALPMIACSVLPTLLFGLWLGQWGSNVIWGSYFGLGWCLSALWSGSIVHDRMSMAIGVAWGWLAAIPLYLASGWLWERLTDRGRKRAFLMLLISGLPMVPAQILMSWDSAGFHLPDYTLHLAWSS